MADEKKPGLLKKIFSFGFGKKKAQPEAEDNSAQLAAAEEEAKRAVEAAAQKEAERLQAIKQAEQNALEASRVAAEKAEAEKKAKEEAEKKAAEEAKAKAEAEAAAAAAAKKAEEERLAAEKKAKEERLAAEKAEQERLKKEADAKKAEEEAKKAAEEEAARKEAQRVEAERIKAEEKAAAEKEAAEKLAEAKRAAEKADAEEAARLELEAAKEVERLQKEREAAEQEEKEKQEAAEQKRQIEAAAEAERLARETAEEERLEAERLAEEEAEKLAAEAKLAEEKAAAEKAAEEKAAAEELAKLEAEKAETEAARLEAERLEQEKLEQERLEKERLELERLEQERLEAEAAALKAKEEAERAAPAEQASDQEIEEDEERKVGWFKRLTKGLARSSNALTENITSVFTKKKLDEETLQDLEDILIQADLGVETAMNITDSLASQRMGKDVTDEEVRQIMADEIQKVLEPVAEPLELDLDHQPHVILVVGVNGSGKTTTIGKLSQKLYNAGFSTLLVAGDTFRAAAVEQLHIWGDRTQAPVMSRPNGSDAAGLAYDAYEEAVKQKRDVMMMDTAGRLQNKKELMDELEKIIRVLKKQDENAPHTVLLTLDATTGQNALNQVEIFKDVAGVNGLVMTKLDGTARGGILVSISAKHKLPVYFIGVGEQVEDLEPFEADVFAKAIAGLSNE